MGEQWYCDTCGMVDSKDVGYKNDQWVNFHYHAYCGARVLRHAPDFFVAMQARIAALEADAANLIKAHNEMHTAAQNHIAELEAENARLREAAQASVNADIDWWASNNDREYYNASAVKMEAHDKLVALLGGGDE